MAESEKSRPHDEVVMNDSKFRLIGIPFFGIIIPNVAGLFGDLSITSFMYWFGYLYFIILAALIWQGNRYLLFRTRQRFTWFDRPIEKLILLLLNNVFYTAPLTIAWLCMWYVFAGFPKTDWSVIQVVVLINVICVLFVTHIYETVFLVKEKANETIKNEQLQRAKAEAELSALKNQIDPHFMFNSLNTLSYLIKADANKANQFTENLAEVYRYILLQRDQSLVLLEDELDFTHKYTELLHLRFGKALIIQKRFNGTAEKDYLIPPTSVFVAFENAVKHNEISERQPLHVEVDVRDGNLQIINTVQQRKNRQHSSRIGLKNLDERFKIITGSGISAVRENGKFIVNLPLVPLNTLT
ncbi:MAG: sensor histidine kinase [Cyclobacteriaceae bacterium]